MFPSPTTAKRTFLSLILDLAELGVSPSVGVGRARRDLAQDPRDTPEPLDARDVRKADDANGPAALVHAQDARFSLGGHPIFRHGEWVVRGAPNELASHDLERREVL